MLIWQFIVDISCAGGRPRGRLPPGAAAARAAARRWAGIHRPATAARQRAVSATLWLVHIVRMLQLPYVLGVAAVGLDRWFRDVIERCPVEHAKLVVFPNPVRSSLTWLSEASRMLTGRPLRLSQTQQSVSRSFDISGGELQRAKQPDHQLQVSIVLGMCESAHKACRSWFGSWQATHCCTVEIRRI